MDVYLKEETLYRYRKWKTSVNFHKWIDTLTEYRANK